MLFNSIHFLIFFPIVVFLYFSLKKYRWVLLLIASYYFYMSWKAEYIILIMISTVIDYFAAIRMHESTKDAIRKRYLWLSLSVNLGLLFAFKYFNFFSQEIRDLISLFSIQFSAPVLNVILPLGISFYTFQTLCYTIDVYNRKIEPERHLGIFAVYVSFFPQLVAGPIERAGHLIPQLKKEYKFDYQRVTDGLKLMLWGFFKKVVIADRLSIVVDAVYSNPTDYTGTPLILATVFFAFQIYCDFSGYTDIAIGAAQVLGVKLSDNFKRPYYSKSVAEFWKRWHISLSVWFEDYVFKPLYVKFSRQSKIENAKLKHNVSFFVSSLLGITLLGLWHGANWTFVIFGMYYGVLIPLYYFNRNWWGKMNKFVRMGLTFIIVNIGWVIFRSNNVSDMVYILTHMFSGVTLSIAGISFGDISREGMIIAIGSILFMEAIHLMQEFTGMRSFMDKRPIWIRWPIYLIIILAILLFGVYKEIPFIYFQF